MERPSDAYAEGGDNPIWLNALFDDVEMGVDPFSKQRFEGKIHFTFHVKYKFSI